MENRSRHTSVAVLGATGSIGTATLDVLDSLGSEWRPAAITAHSRFEQLVQLAQRFQPQMIAATGLRPGQESQLAGLPTGCRLLTGPDSLVEIAESPDIGTVVGGVVGSAGLLSSLAAARAGKRLALANKEALVVAGELLTSSISQAGGELIPVDSEHSAIFQALRSGERGEVKRLILTASGGPFRSWTGQQLETASVADALEHPTWQMGPKITIDSATMMNKALEVIEARWLFDLPADKISVVVHPQSVIHSLVEYVDGSVLAQLSPPDMRLPIQYALTYPRRVDCPCPKMDWSDTMHFDFEPVDTERFPALELGWEVARRGGSCGAVVNAANEAAVQHFLAGHIKFTDIVAGCRRILEEHHYDPHPSLEELLRLDRWAREEIDRWASVC